MKSRAKPQKKRPWAEPGPRDPQHFALQQDVPAHIGHPGGQVVGPVQGFPLPVDLDSLQKSPEQHTQGGGGEGVHGNEHYCAVADVPVEFA